MSWDEIMQGCTNTSYMHCRLWCSSTSRKKEGLKIGYYPKRSLREVVQRATNFGPLTLKEYDAVRLWKTASGRSGGTVSVSDLNLTNVTTMRRCVLMIQSVGNVR